MVTPDAIAPTEAATVRDRSSENAWTVAALFGFALVVGAYFTFRFGGRWVESDSAGIADAIRNMQHSGSLMPTDGAIYPNGYAFTALSVFLVTVTGVSVQQLIQLIYPIVSASLALIAWPLYRDLTGSPRGATLATLFLFIQPEFLFVILRGSHERILRMLLFASLWLIVRSFRLADRPGAYAANVVLFYGATFGVIATNAFFGSSYIWALGVALIGSWLGGYLGPGLRAVSLSTRKRLTYVPLFCFVLVFMFTNYLYPPAGSSMSQVTDIYDRLSRLFLTTNPSDSNGPVTPYNAYAGVFEQWIDIRVYFLLSAGTYFLIVSSALIWVRVGLRWLAGSDRPTLGPWVLWLLYAGFALQGGMSIVADRSGALAGNLQYRAFPSFVMVAAPMVAMELARLRPNARLRAAGAIALGLLAIFGVVKATNEPAISNSWTFYVPAESAAVLFITEHVKEANYWSGFDVRIRALQELISDAPVQSSLDVDPSNRAYLVTDVMRALAARLGRPMPPVAGELRVYDDGAAQIYRTRARSAAQD